MEINTAGQKIFEFVEPQMKEEGFEATINEKPNLFSVKFSQDKGEIVSSVSFSVFQKDNSVFGAGGFARILIPAVENFMIPFLVKHKIVGESSSIEPYSFFPVIEHSIVDYQITNIEHLEKFALLFLGYFDVEAYPAFERFKDLNSISEFIETIDQKKISDYFPKGIYRKAVIWKLTKNNNYNEYINWLVNGMIGRAAKNPKNPQHEKSAQSVKALKEELDVLKIEN